MTIDTKENPMTIDTDRLRALAALDPDTVRALLDAAELGLAWQRAEAALPKRWSIALVGDWEDGWEASADGYALGGTSDSFHVNTAGGWFGHGGSLTPAAALNALADALEARSAG